MKPTFARPLRIHVAGDGQTGGIPDPEETAARACLQPLHDLVELTSLEDAEVVHAVRVDRVLEMDPRSLDGKRVVCHLSTEVSRAFEIPIMVRAREHVGLWLTASLAAEASLMALGYRARHLPPIVDTLAFTEKIPGGVCKSGLRTHWNIPSTAYVVGNLAPDTGLDDKVAAEEQQGMALLLNILKGLRAQGLAIHPLLTGAGRHWIRSQLTRAGIAFTFVGRQAAADSSIINLLYHSSDLCLLTSRVEGRRAVLEACATRTRILSTPAGVACDLLEPKCLFRSVDEGMAFVAADIREGVLESAVPAHYRRVCDRHTAKSVAPLWRELYQTIETVPVFRAPREDSRRPLSIGSRLQRRFFAIGALARTALSLPPRPGDGLCIGLWHEFHKPPYGGGNQFMTALRAALLRQGVRVVSNRMTSSVDVHLCNSAWFDVKIFERAARRRPVRMIHRVDGPVALYRGTDWTEDERIHDLNLRHATATVFQSDWSFRKLREHGLEFVRPMIIRNAVDEAYFHPPPDRTPAQGRRVRLISTAWSDNPSKGGALYKWLDDHLDWSRFEYTFVGRVSQTFRNIRHLPPKDSLQLGALLRSHDLYITASQNDPCSNALLEAMSCGLPALYYQHGGHGELAGFAGLPFTGPEDVLPQLNRLVENLEAFSGCSWLPSIADIARRYIELARLLVADVS